MHPHVFPTVTQRNSQICMLSNTTALKQKFPVHVNAVGSQSVIKSFLRSFGGAPTLVSDSALAYEKQNLYLNNKSKEDSQGECLPAPQGYAMYSALFLLHDLPGLHTRACHWAEHLSPHRISICKGKHFEDKSFYYKFYNVCLWQNWINEIWSLSNILSYLWKSSFCPLGNILGKFWSWVKSLL